MIDRGTSAPSWLFTFTSVVVRSVGAPNFPSGCRPVLVALPAPSTAKISVARVQALRATIAPSVAALTDSEARGAVDREADLGRAARAPGEALEALHRPVAGLEVESVAGGGDLEDHLVRGRHDGGGRLEVGLREARAHHREARARRVGHEVDVVALHREAGHLVRDAADLRPGRAGLAHGLEGRGVERDLALDVGDDHRHRVARAGRDDHERLLRRGHRHARRDPGAQDERVPGRVGRERVAPQAHVLVALRGGRARGRLLQAQVEERLAVGHPADSRVGPGILRAVDGLADALAGGGLDHGEDRLLGTRGRHAERDVAAVRRREPVVDGVGLAGPALPVVRVGHEGFLPVRPAHVELEGVVRRAAAREEERAVRHAAQVGDDRVPRVVELGDAREERLVALQAAQRGVGLVRVRLHPGGDLRILHALEGAVGVVDHGAEEGLRDVLRGKHGQRLGNGRAGGERRACGKEAGGDLQANLRWAKGPSWGPGSRVTSSRPGSPGGRSARR